MLADIRTVFDRLKVEVIFTKDLLAELAGMDPRWRRLDGKRLARTLHSYGMNQTNKDQRIGAKVTKGYLVVEGAVESLHFSVGLRTVRAGLAVAHAGAECLSEKL